MIINEFAYAIVVANRVLDRPNGDPDDDLAVLARQFLRACERARDIPPPPTNDPAKGAEGIANPSQADIYEVGLAQEYQDGPIAHHLEKWLDLATPKLIAALEA